MASTSYPSYLWCEFWPLTRATSSDSVKDGYKVVASVRNPLGRFVSAVSEILQRSVNGYCPSGYCDAGDSYFGNVTLEEFKQVRA